MAERLDGDGAWPKNTHLDTPHTCKTSVAWAVLELNEAAPDPAIDLVEELRALVARAGFGVHSRGAKRELIETAANRMKERNPGLQISGIADGYFGADEAPERARAVRESGATLLFVVIGARKRPDQFETTVVATSQHREMLDQMLETFEIMVNFDLDIMKPNQDLRHVTTAALSGLHDVIGQVKPDWVIVQGDTTTTFCGALAAFYYQISVAHVEAGLRTYNKR